MFLSGSINQDTYKEMLQQELDPFLEVVKADGHTNFVFQHDNVCPHITKNSIEFLNALARKHELTLMEWIYLLSKIFGHD